MLLLFLYFLNYNYFLICRFRERQTDRTSRLHRVPKRRRGQLAQSRVASEPGVSIRSTRGSGTSWCARLQHLQMQGRPRTLHHLSLARLSESKQLQVQDKTAESVALQVARPAAGDPRADRSRIP